MKLFITFMLLCSIWTLCSELQQITYDPANDLDPFWSPDGTNIVFWSNRTGLFQIWGYSISNNQSSIIWNGTDQSDHPVSSGIYYCKLNIPNSPVKKIMLIK
ncbi:TolB family protein [Candidatus Cloacimonadota bacterium]